MKPDNYIHLFINEPYTEIFCGIDQAEAGAMMGARGLQAHAFAFHGRNMCPECMKIITLRELARLEL